MKGVISVAENATTENTFITKLNQSLMYNFTMNSTMKKAGGISVLLCLFILCSSKLFSQTMTRQDKIFIQHGIMFQSWVPNEHNGGASAVPKRQPIVIGRTGRYIRVQQSNPEPLSMAEVQVFSGGVNVALNKATQQSSNTSPTAGLSPLAVDGNTDSLFAHGSVMCTREDYGEKEAWWKVDLGTSVAIDSIILWKRMDTCCLWNFNGFFVFVADNPIVSNTLEGAVTQPGVAAYTQPLSSPANRYPTAAELSNAHLTPTYYQLPTYNYQIHIQDPTLSWGIAQAGKQQPPKSGLRPPSANEQANGFLNSMQENNIANLRTLCVGDEENYSSATATILKAWFDIARAKYPNALLHGNQYTGQWNASQMSTYMQMAQPDLVTFDTYYFKGPGAVSTYGIYRDMQTYRSYALRGNDGSGNAPIGFGGYLQAYNGGNASYPDYRPSESQFNLNAFAYLTMGAKWLSEFLYRAYTWDIVNERPTAQYYQIASIGQQIAKLSPHLSRLRTSDVRFLPGQNSGGTNVSPNNIAQWSVSADPYVKDIATTNLGTFNNGLKGDVLIGYFKPVPGLDNTAGITMAPVPATYTKYFMVLNGLAQPNGCCTNIATDTIQGKANLTRQKITLTIDFGEDPVDTLYRVRRSDGVVEMVPLTSLGGTQYSMSDTLDGGLADLFYWKNQGKPLAPPTSGTALQLSSGTVSAGNVTALSGASKFTLEGWVKFNATTPWSTIFSRWVAADKRIMLTANSSNGIHVIVSNGQINYANTAGNIITPGQWYHLAMVYDGTQSADTGKLKLFINGQQQVLTFGGGAVPATTAVGTAPLAIGKNMDPAGPSYFLDGSVDEVRVWNTAVGQTEIAAWKNKPLGACHVYAANLQLYWPLNDASNPAIAAPSLGTAYTGSIVNGTYVTGGWANGSSGCTIPGKSLQFSTGSVSAGNVTALNGASKFTMEAWVKFNATTPWSTIFYRSGGATNRIAFTTNASNGLHVVVANGQANYANSASNIITPGQWYHVAIVYDGTQATDAGKLKLFVNGQPQPLTFSNGYPVPAAVSSGTVPLVVGAEILYNTGYLNGVVDEVRVWNAALSQTTLTDWKDKSLGACHPNAANLQVYWQMNDDANPAVVAPSLGTNYTGSIINATYFGENQATGESECLQTISGNNAAVAKLIRNENKSAFIKAYPNPLSEGLLYLEIQSSKADNAIITVFDSFGRKVYNASLRVEKGMNKTSINLSSQVAGIYIIQVRDSISTKQYKIVKN